MKAVEALGKIGCFTSMTDHVTVCRDLKDDIFLARARTVSAEAIISGDKDLLTLRVFDGIRILTPREFMDEIP